MGMSHIKIGIKMFATTFRGILTGVCSLVLEHLDELVEARRQERAEDWSNPVYPVVAVEMVRYDGGAEGAGGVDGAACVVDSFDDVLENLVEEGKNWEG
jgi:hypothetical protein